MSSTSAIFRSQIDGNKKSMCPNNSGWGNNFQSMAFYRIPT